MRTLLLSILAVIASFSSSHFVRADEKPQTFALYTQGQDARQTCLSPDGTLMCVSYGGVRTIRNATASFLWLTVSSDLFFSPDGLTAITIEDFSHAYPRWPSCSHIIFHVVEARTGKYLRDFSDLVNRTPEQPTKREEDPNKKEEEDVVLDATFNDTGSEFLVATRCFLRRFDVQRGRLISATRWHTPSKQNLQLSSASIAPDGAVIFGIQENIHVFSTQDAHQTRIIKARATRIVSISPRSYLLAIQRQEVGGVDVVSASDGHRLWSLPDSTLKNATFSLHHDQVFVVSKHGLDIYDALTGYKFKTVRGLTNKNIAPSPNGRYLYEAHGDKIYCWGVL